MHTFFALCIVFICYSQDSSAHGGLVLYTFTIYILASTTFLNRALL